MNNLKTDIPEDERRQGLYALSSSLRPLAGRLLGKKGFIEIDIIANWDKIVGTELAQYSFPQKIDFKKGEKNNGILHLSVPSGAFALEIQHREKHIIDKINTYFGYNAVSSLRIVQNAGLSQLPTQPPPANFQKKSVKLTENEEKYIENLAEPIDNPKLKAIIAKLGRDIFKDNKNKK